MTVFLDTNILIYAVENPPVFGADALARLGSLRSASDNFMVSDLTRMECVLGPLAAGDTVLEAQSARSSPPPACRSCRSPGQSATEQR